MKVSLEILDYKYFWINKDNIVISECKFKYAPKNIISAFDIYEMDPFEEGVINELYYKHLNNQ